MTVCAHVWSVVWGGVSAGEPSIRCSDVCDEVV